MAAKKPENMSLEASLEELESLVADLEQGELPLEDSLKQFERGVSLVKASQLKLAQAEQKVQIMTQNSVDSPLESFEPEEK
ncbi:exodeoxyribonuclease VII small subunit [Saccharobesus litoralis]|uniref:Exodeoxyribonuclease 7 small subunit n=1 Tax=Saccharobesus litoralis TaxID=2172099 RepID=A0A2S0VLL2_9ALTE|nr:exodeoxyribonuclease VII small subunit [Saccharobesus litoralis]AWB65099.1 exodeoxyribonuclease VII small subunit [Saccharobesus litoralis]